MFRERDKFTQYLEDIVQDFNLKNLGKKPDLPWKQCSDALWRLNDRARGALLVEHQRSISLLATNYLQDVQIASDAFVFGLNLDSYYEQLKDRFDSLSACLTIAQRKDRRVYDVALCLEIYVLSREIIEDQGRVLLPNFIDRLVCLLSELSVAKKLPIHPFPRFPNNLPTLKVKPQSRGGTSHSIKDEIIILIRMVPDYSKQTAKECWSYLEEKFAVIKEMKIEKYTFTFSHYNNELMYSWVSSTTRLESEKAMKFKTFQTWFSKAKNPEN